ncbi:hypothetical protein LJC43_07880, partial [Parabacteroides sp. OttesenSCG-928-G21]|nr:hypothetical protein [Parabacteroides sp. OttesenSCG-928-G21]
LLAERLERFLKKELAERTSLATDGFYALSFDDLSVNVLNGELRIEGIRLHPDPAVFEQWKNRDSLPDLYIKAAIQLIDFKGVNLIWKWRHTQLHFQSFEINDPEIQIFSSKYAWEDVEVEKVQEKTLYEMLSPYIDLLTVKTLNLNNASVLYNLEEDSSTMTYALDDFTFHAYGFRLDSLSAKSNRLLYSDQIDFSIRNLSLPLDNGCYTLNIGELRLNNTDLNADSIYLKPAYAKMEFAHKHPKHADWFDVRIGGVELKGIDIPGYLSEKVVRMQEANISDVVLQNFKNQQIIVPRRIIPMIYEGLQKAPVKFFIPNLNISNLFVVYEELAKKGTEPGRLYLTDMYGTFAGFTNIVSSPEQFIRLDAEGKLMGEGLFTATWMLPVDSLHDQFLLHAQMERFDLKALNELIVPLAAVRVESGQTSDFVFDMDAGSKRATIRMEFPYQNLKAEVLKEKDGELAKNGLLSFLANELVKNNNPDHPDSKGSRLRDVHLTVVRDPYHSTFNYLWQILRPALAESVGISETKQKTAAEAMKFINEVKNLFHKQSKSEASEEREGK